MNSKHSIRGVALSLVLWCIAFVAGLVVLVGGSVSSWIDAETLAEKKFVARQMALSGLAMGLNPAVKPGDPLLRRGSKDAEGFEVAIANESAKLNPNFWIEQNNRTIFTRLFASWGADMTASDAAIDSLKDWIDGDDFLSMKGAERGEYEKAGRPGFPPNRPIKNIREMEAVMNLAPILASKEDWRNAFTIWYSGKISIQHADPNTLISIAGLTPKQCQALVEMRAGLDRIEGTDDDQKFQSMAAVATLLGADVRQREALVEFFDTSGDVRRIESTGWCAGVSHKITVIAGEGGSAQLMGWEER